MTPKGVRESGAALRFKVYRRNARIGDQPTLSTQAVGIAVAGCASGKRSFAANVVHTRARLAGLIALAGSTSFFVGAPILQIVPVEAR